MSVEDFKRVNDPRIEKILGFIEMIEKSARSYRVPDDVLDDTFDKIVNACPAPSTVEDPPCQAEKMSEGVIEKKEVPVLGNGAIQEMAKRYEDLPTSNLIDIMAAAGAALAKRRR